MDINVGEVLTALSCALIIVIGAYLFQRKRRQQMRKVGTIEKLIIYPIKSCGGVEVSTAECTSLGLKNGLMRDRSFAIMKEDGNFLSAFDRLKMTTIIPHFHDDQMTVNAPGMEPLNISISELESQHLKVISSSYKGIEIEGYDCGQSCSEWLERCLDHPSLRLIYLASNLKPGYACQKNLVGQLMRETDVIPYSFTSSYMLMCQASLGDLNQRMEQPISVFDFRPNVFVNNKNPYEEEQWSRVQLGDDALLKTLKLCQRCPRVNINALTGELRPKEPLRTLRSYHLCKDHNLNKITKSITAILGLNLGIDQTGVVRVGDAVYAALT